MRSKPGNNRAPLVAVVVVALGAAAAADYRNDFSNASPGQSPKDMQSVGGAFGVADFQGNKVLEFPGEPLEIGGVLFGPSEAAVDVRVKVWAETSGRRFPEYGVGAGDVAGYRLMYLPAQRRLELRRGDQVVTASDNLDPFTPGRWLWMRLRLAKSPEGRWFADGKLWPAEPDVPEPPSWKVTAEVKQAPSPGRASLWAVPFPGKPIRFDDVSVSLPDAR
jgi:hypothetical protein